MHSIISFFFSILPELTVDLIQFHKDKMNVQQLL